MMAGNGRRAGDELGRELVDDGEANQIQHSVQTNPPKTAKIPTNHFFLLPSHHLICLPYNDNGKINTLIIHDT